MIGMEWNGMEWNGMEWNGIGLCELYCMTFMDAIE